MTLFERIFLALERCCRSLRFQTFFRGTTSFQAPQKWSFRGNTYHFKTPPHPSHSHDFINLALDDEYGLRQLPSAPKTILDIGTNCGLFSILARQNFPSSTIHSYEPNPKAFTYASQNLAPLNIQLFQEGIGSTNGKANISNHDNLTLSQTERQDDGPITITSLEDAILRFPTDQIDLLKIDCEGAEWDIFQNPAPFQKVKLIRMEYHLNPNQTLDQFLGLIQPLNFIVEKTIPNQGFGILWLKKQSFTSCT